MYILGALISLQCCTLWCTFVSGNHYLSSISCTLVPQKSKPSIVSSISSSSPHGTSGDGGAKERGGRMACVSVSDDR